MATDTVAINAAFLQEIKEDNEQLRVLLAQAKRMCEEAIASACKRPRRLASMLAELRDQLAMHFALEEAYGYFDNPLSVAPYLSIRAVRSRGEHTDFYEEICRLAEIAEHLVCCKRRRNGVRRLARDFLDFLSRLEDHEAEENGLIALSYNVGVGVGDWPCTTGRNNPETRSPQLCK